ncbi:hypothetical protein AJ79_01626 [Helicocarpus griseus UAMH5409]|uniref:Uncharacterized protein n=1 Tax=Helicocarpus griseus UAMH5409 TaxID=1447875 RepID=A0A2B7Y694_9EURO|nr:hypothetical protein AJ79_01626 [Helicocarpus griseus UAMH5409]
MEIFAHETDVRKCVEDASSDCTLKTFLEMDPNLKENIIMRINESAAGMFLLVQQQIHGLCSQTSRKKARNFLDTLPASIDASASYDDSMKRINSQHPELVKLVKSALSCILRAIGPLSAEKLREEQAIEVGLCRFEEGFLNVDILLNVSAGLIRFDKESSTVGLAHYSLYPERLSEVESNELFLEALTRK